MKISANDWNGYIRRLARINQKAADRMQAWVERYGLNDVAAVTEYAYALASRYGEGAAELACELYDAIAAAQGVAVPAAVPAATAAYGDVARTVNGVLKQSAALVPSAVGRMVKQAGEDTTLQNALRDGAEFAWIPSGDTGGRRRPKRPSKTATRRTSTATATARMPFGSATRAALRAMIRSGTWNSITLPAAILTPCGVNGMRRTRI